MVPDLFRIVKRRKETADTFTLELVGPPLQFRPGQFNMLYHFGIGESAISISGDSRRPDRIVHTIRAVGTVTRALGRLKTGDTVGVRGPFGNPWPVEAAYGKDVILAAGGIGLAPLRPALYQVLAERERFGRVILLYGCRTPADMLYEKELARWRGAFDLDVQVTVDRAEASWRGLVGVVTTLIPRLQFDTAGAVAMVCGPEIMMRFTALELKKRGLDEASIYVSMERNMKCGIGLCGHCQWGAPFVCTDGPVFRYDRVRPALEVREL